MGRSLREFAESVVRRLADGGFRALFAGGCVRDRLMGREPKDYDVATSARPEEVTRLFPRSVPVGAAFGVIRVLESSEAAGPDSPFQVEVATFRTEGEYRDGRRPSSVSFSGEEEDVRRRDFTVNGLLYDPLHDQVLDYVEGRRDLERKIIRAIGDPVRRFEEDRLRLLRAIRFAATLDFEIEGHTFAALRKCAGEVISVSAERIRDELSLMLTGPNPRRAFELLHSSRLLAAILPEVEAMAGVEQPLPYHPEGDVWTHTLLLLGQLSEAPLSLALGALLHDVGKPPTFNRAPDRIRFHEHEKVGARMAEEILRRLRFPNPVVERVVELVDQHMTFKDVTHMRPATLKRFLRLSGFEEHLELHRIDCRSSHGNLEAYEFCRAQRVALSEEALRPPPLITGRDLEGLGLVPGPIFGKILREVEDRQLDGSFVRREQALEYVRQHYLAGQQGTAPETP